MKTLFLFFLICSSAIGSFSQNPLNLIFPTDSAMWKIGVASGPNDYHYYSNYSGDSTFINGHNYIALHRGNAGWNIHPTPFGYYRIDGNQVYYHQTDINYPIEEFKGIFDQNKELMLYDFDIQVGDTFHSNLYFDYPENEYVAILSQIDTVEINNITTYQYTFNRNDSLYPYQWDPVIWTKGIGSNQGLFTIPFQNLGVKFFVCNSNPTFFSADEQTRCDTILLSSDDLDVSTSVKIFPSPANSQLTISSETPIHSIKIFNTNGQLIDNTPLMTREFTFDVTTYVAGVYMISIQTEKGNFTHKFVKN